MRIRFFFFVGIILIFCVVLVSAIDSDNMVLNGGKNVIVFGNKNPMYVSDLIRLNPEIEVVSFKEGTETLGYVNFLGGVGEDFIVYGDSEYEVIVNKNISLVLP